MSEDVIERRAAALEPGADLGDLAPDEQVALARIRTMLAHPAVWTPAPDIAAHPAGIDAPAVAGGPAPTTSPVTPAGAPAHADGAARPSRPRRGLPRWSWGIAVVAGLAAAVFAVGSVLLPARAQMRVELAGTAAAPAARASVAATKLDAGWHLTLSSENLPGAAEDQYYQGWVVRGETYVPLGTFHLRQSGEVELWAGVAVDEYDRLEITRQRVGGGQEPGDVVLAGPIPPA